MKLIKISTDLELSVHEFPDGTHEEQNQFLRELIGNDCRIYEHVMPDHFPNASFVAFIVKIRLFSSSSNSCKHCYGIKGTV